MGYKLGILAAVVAILIGVKLLTPAPVKPAVLAGKAVQLVFPGKGGSASGGFGDESLAAIEDVQYTEEKEVNWPAILEADFARLSPYAIDYDNARVVLTEVDPSDLQDKNVTFFYQAQRKHMVKAYAVPVALFASSVSDFMAKVGEANVNATLAKTIFLFSTGRCGSTLLSKLLGQIDATYSLHEPDIYTAVTSAVNHPALKNKLTAQQIQDVLRFSTWMLVHATHLNNPSATFVEIKLRSYCVEVAEQIKQATPEVKTIFLYRNAVDTIDSFCVAFATSTIGTAIRALHLDSLLLTLYPALRDAMPVLARLASDSRFPADEQNSMGAVGLMTMMWLSTVDKAVEITKRDPKFFNIIVRYEDLVSQRMAVLREISSRCDMSEQTISETKVNAIFDADAHVPTSRTASKRGPNDKPLYIRDADHESLKRLLSGHEVIKDGYFVIDGTYIP